MNYLSYKKYDVLDGPGVRNTLFVSGCHFHCKGCFNARSWNPNNGIPYTKEFEDKLITDLKNSVVSGFTLLGGEPFDNCDGLLPLVIRIRKECPNKDIWSWSGFTYEDLLAGTKKQKKMLSLLDVLVDGRFILAKRDVSLQFRGSSNQRIIEVQQSLKRGKVVLWEDEYKC